MLSLIRVVSVYEGGKILPFSFQVNSRGFVFFFGRVGKKIKGRVELGAFLRKGLLRSSGAKDKIILQRMTMEMVKALKSIAPEGKDFSEEFQKIIQEGAGGKEWEPEHNQNWDRHTRVLVEAFLHARFFLEMAVKYGKELERPPETLPYGWAALLCLYQVR